MADRSGAKRLILCTYESLYSDCVLSVLEKSNLVEIVGIVASTRILKQGEFHLASKLSLLRKSGLSYALYLASVTDPLAARFSGKSIASLSHWSERLNVPLLKTENINDPASLDTINALSPDILLSAHFNQIFKEPALTRFSKKLFNLHPGLLPRRKGLDPMFCALRDRDERVGVTLHQIDAGIDTGNAIGIASFEPQSRSLRANNEEAFTLGADLFLDRVEHDFVPADPLNEGANGSSSYESYPTPSDVVEFLKAGNRFN
ncbi:MAG: formyltransferase family protein [Pseudomonadota bacterium]